MRTARTNRARRPGDGPLAYRTNYVVAVIAVNGIANRVICDDFVRGIEHAHELFVILPVVAMVIANKYFAARPTNQQRFQTHPLVPLSVRFCLRTNVLR